MHPARRTVSEAETRRANRREWDAYADEYQATHGEFLRDVGFVWCPEGVDEADAHVLGDVTGRDVLEVGCGAAQCARWLATHGARAVGLDLSERQLQHSRRIDDATGVPVPVVAGRRPRCRSRTTSFDVVFSAFGALQFVHEAGRAVEEAARVLRPGGRFAFSVTHPCAGACPTTRRPRGWSSPAPTGTGRRTWSRTTTAGSPTPSTTARSATGSATWPAAGSG